jgi:hypothetical protein
LVFQNQGAMFEGNNFCYKLFAVKNKTIYSLRQISFPLAPSRVRVRTEYYGFGGLAFSSNNRYMYVSSFARGGISVQIKRFLSTHRQVLSNGGIVLVGGQHFGHFY